MENIISRESPLETNEVEEVDNQFLLLAEVKKSHENKISFRNVLFDLLLLLAVILNSKKEDSFLLYNSLNTMLEFELDQTVLDPKVNGTIIEEVATMTEGWEKLVGIVNGIIFVPKGQLFAIKTAMFCAEKYETGLDVYQDAVYLATFNQVLGIKVVVKEFSSESDENEKTAIEFYLEGNYNNLRFLKAIEANKNITNPEDVSKIEVKAVFYNDFLQVLALVDLDFEYQGVGSLTKNLHFKSTDPYPIWSPYSDFSITKWFLFIMVILSSFNNVASIFVIIFKLIKDIRVSIKTKIFEIDK